MSNFGCILRTPMKHLKNVHTFQKTIKNKVQLISLAAIALGVMSMLGVAYFSMHESNSHIAQAELEFTEVSSNKNIVGSVMPASCLSYPSSGPRHWVSAIGGADDTFGYCPGTYCGAYSGYDYAASNGTACDYYLTAPNTAIGGTYNTSVSAPGGASGSVTWSCGIGGVWSRSSTVCNVPPPPPAVNIQFVN